VKETCIKCSSVSDEQSDCVTFGVGLLTRACRKYKLSELTIYASSVDRIRIYSHNDIKLNRGKTSLSLSPYTPGKELLCLSIF